ncbi:MAG: beta strand repeat-containing protein [Novosphingobium sp.]
MADIIGTTGSDVLNGTGDADLILTNGGNDTTNAGDGDDTIVVVSQVTPYGTINGGNGIDTLRIDRAVSPLIANSANGVDIVSISSFQSATISSIERIQFNSAAGEIHSATFNFGGNSGSPNQFGAGISLNAELVGGAGVDVLSLRFNNAGLPATVTLPAFTYTNWSTPVRPYFAGDRVAIAISGAGATTVNIISHPGVVGITGGTGDDTVNGSDGVEVFNGAGTGNDVFFGNAGNDSMSIINTYLISNGTPGSESGFTGAGKTFDGGDGTDWLVFGGHVSFAGTVSNLEGIVLSPGYSNNNLPGAAILAGSQYATGVTMANSVLAGFVSNLMLDGVGDITIQLAGGGDTFNGSAFVFEAGSAVNFFVQGSTGADTITGTSRGDTIDGGGGADIVNAGGGDDAVFLSANASAIDGGTGTDNLVVNSNVVVSGSITGFEVLTLVGGATVTFSGAQFSNALAVNSELAGVGSIIVNLAPGNNFFGSQMSVTPGSNLTMSVNGSTGIDVIKAVLGVTNILNGGGDVDQIRGGNFADTINGGDGNDKIMGLSGGDQLTGGAGADQFRYLFAGDSGVGAGNRDLILDFAAGEDKLDFRALDANLSLAGRQTLSFIGTGGFTSGGFGEARYAVSGADLLVQIDLDGNGTTDMEMLLQGAGAQTLTGTDFLF